jgi:hypothetical protein
MGNIFIGYDCKFSFITNIAPILPTTDAFLKGNGDTPYTTLGKTFFSVHIAACQTKYFFVCYQRYAGTC